MAAHSDLAKIAQSMKDLESRFVESPQLGLHLRAEDEAEFKRLALEAKSILDDELGRLNDFSTNLIHAINSGSGGFLGGPSLASVKGARAVVEGGINRIRMQPGTAKAPIPNKPSYVDASRLVELRSRGSETFDVKRLVRLIEELNIAHENDCHMSTAMLVRAIADHVPPIFNCRTFSDVANNYQGSKSFKGSMQHLDKSLRNIADAHLHVQIRSTEALPTAPQVDFRADLDVLLSEVVRVLK